MKIRQSRTYAPLTDAHVEKFSRMCAELRAKRQQQELKLEERK
jgi:hypothetical protein